MHYYLVAVATPRYHGAEGLTYSSVTSLMDGAVVAVPLQKQTVLGFVVRTVAKPSFVAKPVSRSYESLSVPAHLLRLFTWMRSYYPAPLGVTAQLFLPKDLPEASLIKPETNSTGSEIVVKKLPALMPEQELAVEKIKEAGTYLLHGETGSGKTRVYIELARQAIQEGKSAIILTPEISLTPQLSHVFSDTFPGQVSVLHSHLTSAQRRKIWLNLQRQTKPHLVIGPRSALFSPLHTVGLIVVDESHEFAYKQENAPHYHAARVASTLAGLHDARLILGSATPSVSDYYVAGQKLRPIIRMTQLATSTEIATTKVITVDLRNRELLTRDPHLSNPLLEQIDASLKHKQQIMLFINRRGTARIVLCDNCGWQALCPHCDLPLTFHHDTHSLRCHACSHSENAKTSCPSCGNTDITLKSIGTKSIVNSIHKFFPAARIARFDTDNKKGERVNELYDEIQSGQIDILVGTQMLAKGLDLPRLSLVGVINADASLYIPDFTAQERTYQLLYQVIGRIGRGHQAHATAVVQTYTPTNAVITTASKKDWPSFYENELSERQQYMFPPFCYLLKLSVKRAKIATAITAAEKLVAELHTKKLQIIIEGPAPAFHEKLQNKYVWQLIVKSKQRGELLKVIQLLPKDWSFDIDPINLL